jgi:hypothetical protein
MRAAPAAAGFGNARLAAGAVTGALTGSIVDSSGAAVPGAQVEVKNLVTGAVRNTVSGPAGLFVLNSLEPARYSLTARATGFKTYESTNLDVTASGALNLGKVPLALGALTEEIAVTAAATPVQTASSENSKLADSSQIADLTLKGRDLFAELATAPGVSLGSTHLTGGNATSESSGLQSQINGAIAGRANVTVNGVTGLETGAGKLDPALAALLHGPHAAASGALVIVRIALANATKDALAQLKKAGVTSGRRKGNDVTGRVAVQNLDAVARLAFVVWIAPQ